MFCWWLACDPWKSVDDKTSANVNEAGPDNEPSLSPSSSVFNSTTSSGYPHPFIESDLMTPVGIVATTAKSQLNSLSFGFNDCGSMATSELRRLIPSLDERMQGRGFELTRMIKPLLESPRPLF